MQDSVWLGYFPGQYHDFATVVAFADAHTEIHRWRDPRTRALLSLTRNQIVEQPANEDISWLQARTSAAK
jgi:hypothetical protein